MIAKVTPTMVAGVMILVIAGVVPVGEWTHLAFQYDGTDKVVYLNGVESARECW